jgi:L-amino acid N-acyltransferase YncA
VDHAALRARPDSANRASIGLHKSLWFREVGILQSVGFKFDRWVDSVLMHRDLDGALCAHKK